MKFVIDDFFVLRAPLLPLDQFTTWGQGIGPQDRASWRLRLRHAVDHPVVRAALFLASSTLFSQLTVWLRDPESTEGQKIERSLVRYFSRMCGRSTPFGLFAGVTVGHFGTLTSLTIGDSSEISRHTRVDGGCVEALSTRLLEDPAVRGAVEYEANTSLYAVGGQARFAASRGHGASRSYQLMSLTLTAELQALLHGSVGGASLSLIARAVADACGSPTEDAVDYVAEAINAQILVPRLAPPITCQDPLAKVAAAVDGYSGTLGHEIATCAAAVRDLDRRPHEEVPQAYQSVGVALADLGVIGEMSRIFQVDSVRPGTPTLGLTVRREIERAIAVLPKLVLSMESEDLRAFRKAFLERYELREVPLLEALDAESGIGFGPPHGDVAPLLRGLPGLAAKVTETWSEREAFLLTKIVANPGASAITLTDVDVHHMATACRDALPLPDAFAVTCSIAAVSPDAVNRGDFSLFVRSISGPSGANLLGRFGHADPALREHLRRHVSKEEALHPDAIFAEVIHVPEGRLANVLTRPPLRDYEIPFLGASEAADNRVLTPQDLTVRIEAGRIVLRSRRLQRTVFPRITSAFNLVHPVNQGVHRFLGLLQVQGVAGAVSFNWGVLGNAPHLPRVNYGRLVLSLERWNLEAEAFRAAEQAAGPARITALREVRASRSIPRFVSLVEADQLLPIDLENPLSVDAFLQHIRHRHFVAMTEVFPAPDEAVVEGPDGKYVHELIVPCVKQNELDGRQAEPASPSGPPIMTGRRSFPPGSEWLYARLYTGPAGADHVLRQIVQPLVAAHCGASALERAWFFVRYGDPWHLRLRVQGDPKYLLHEVLPELHERAMPLLANGMISRITVDTYEQEVERYGGGLGILLAERTFHVDSVAMLNAIVALADDRAQEARALTALYSVHLLLLDAGLDADARRDFVRSQRDAYRREIDSGGEFRQVVGENYRANRERLGALIRAGEGIPAAVVEGLQNRSNRLRDILRTDQHLTRYLRQSVASFAHMSVNRLLRSSHRRQELVIYEYLSRLYEAERFLRS